MSILNSKQHKQVDPQLNKPINSLIYGTSIFKYNKK